MIYVILGFLGLAFGSFINAFVYRLHEKLDDDGNTKKISAKQKKDLSILKGRSICPSCKHVLGASDLVPVFSWLFLRGKCRYCKKPISWQYPAVELITALLFVVSFVVWPGGLDNNWQIISFITWLVALIGLIALAVYDIKWMLLPNKIIYPFAAFVLVSLVVQMALGRSIKDLIGIGLALLVTAGVFWVLYVVSKGKWIGGGDVKLGLLTGLLLASLPLAFLYIFLASIFGMIYTLPLLATNRISPKSKIPFGPFLIAGCIAAVLWGQAIINWYTSLISVT